jgi:SH3-like domain-containing protein
VSGFVLLRLAVAAIVGLGIAASSIAVSGAPAVAQDVVVGPSGLPLPRFVSLKAARVNLRIGPGRNYSVDWLYLTRGLPMEIIQEYDNWRRVRDAEGTEGWIEQSLLSGRRTAIAAPWQRNKNALIPLLAKADRNARAVASLEPGVVGTVESCTGEWCRISVDGHSGWLQQSQLWGVYPGERVEG